MTLETRTNVKADGPGSPAEGSATDADRCQSALKAAFDRITANGAVSMGSAAGAEIPEELEGLIDDAVAQGWDHGTAEDAVRALAREQLGARGASFD